MLFTVTVIKGMVLELEGEGGVRGFLLDFPLEGRLYV